MTHGHTPVLFFGEIHEKIRILNLVIKPSISGQENLENQVQISIKNNRISILRGMSESEISFKDFTVQPLSSQSATVINNDEVHLRLQITFPINEVRSPEELDLQEKLLTNTKEEGVFNIQCKKCQSAITHFDRKFSRVLDLPSENWHEYLDIWCCHGNDAITKLKKNLEPRFEDCLLGTSYILVHTQAVVPTNVEIIKENEIYQVLCKRCQAVVGELNLSETYDDSTITSWHDLNNSHSVKLYKYSISLILNLDSTPRNIFRDFGEEVYMARKFLTLTKTHLCRKFIINGTKKKKNDKVPCFVLLWILNTDAKFLTCHHNEKGFTECTADNKDKFSALKILYKCYLDQNFERLRDEWYGSAQTDVVTFPEKICLNLLLKLDQNYKMQPPSMRHTSGLNVSFLKLE